MGKLGPVSRTRLKNPAYLFLERARPAAPGLYRPGYSVTSSA